MIGDCEIKQEYNYRTKKFATQVIIKGADTLYLSGFNPQVLIKKSFWGKPKVFICTSWNTEQYSYWVFETFTPNEGLIKARSLISEIQAEARKIISKQYANNLCVKM